MSIKALCEETILQAGVLGILPEVVVLPWVVLEVKEFSHPLPVVDDQFVGPGPVHGGEGSTATSEDRVECVEVFAAHEVPVLSPGLALQDGQERSSLLVVRLPDASEVKEGCTEVQ